MNTYTVVFKPRGALSTWPLSSDTLFGAVCWGIRVLGLMDDHELSAWLEASYDQPLFAFSQAFPIFESKQRVYRFYPRPVSFQPGFTDFDILVDQMKSVAGRKSALLIVTTEAKRLKKVQYLSEQALFHWMNGSLRPIDVLQSMIGGKDQWTVRAGAICSTNESEDLPDSLLISEAMQHNEIDRMAGATVEGRLFYREEVFFSRQVGLWALLMAEQDVCDSYIFPALRYLADTGLGADRTTGKGQFEIMIQPAPVFSTPATAYGMMSLSRYIPLSGEVNLLGEPLAYQLRILHPKREQKFPRALIGGQTSAPIYKASVPVFEPGSVFPFLERKSIYGRLVRLSPNDQESIFQSGAAIMIPFGLGETA